MSEDQTCLTDGSQPSPGYTETKENGQQVDYLVLCPEERAKGFIRPYRDSYIHVGKKLRGELEMLEEPIYIAPPGKMYVAIDRFELSSGAKAGTYLTQEEVDQIARTGHYGGCGVLTKMSSSIAETYARNPKFYSGTFCCGCGAHFPVGEFVWDDGPVVGS